MEKRATLKDIAIRCGVSPTIVSVVLNNREGKIFCTPERRAEILRVAAELNYRPNLLARSMVAQKLPLVGIMLNLHEEDFQARRNSYFLRILPTMTFQLNQYHLEVLFIPYSDEKEQIERLDNLIGNNLIGGVITNIIPWSYRQIAGYLKQVKIPYMVLGYPDKEKLYCAYFASSPNILTLEYIKKNGFKKIYSVTSLKDELYFSGYPYPENYHWLAPREEPDKHEYDSPEVLFLCMGNNIHEKLRRNNIILRNEIIFEEPEHESAIPDGIPYLLIDNKHYHQQITEYATSSLVRWMQDDIPPVEKIHEIRGDKEAVIKRSGL